MRVASFRDCFKSWVIDMGRRDMFDKFDGMVGGRLDKNPNARNFNLCHWIHTCYFNRDALQMRERCIKIDETVLR